VGKPLSIRSHGSRLNAITLYSYGPTGKPGGDAVGLLPRPDGGFTLIELIVALAVVGLMLAFTLPRVAGWLDRLGFSAGQERLKRRWPNCLNKHGDLGTRFSYVRAIAARTWPTPRQSSSRADGP